MLRLGLWLLKDTIRSSNSGFASYVAQHPKCMVYAYYWNVSEIPCRTHKLNCRCSLKGGNVEVELSWSRLPHAERIVGPTTEWNHHNWEDEDAEALIGDDGKISTLFIRTGEMQSKTETGGGKGLCLALGYSELMIIIKYSVLIS